MDRGQLDVRGRLVVRRVVGEDGGAVEGAVVFGEVEPALVADAFRALAADADADDVRAGVEEAFAEGNEILVADLLGQGVDGHGRDELLVGDRLACFEDHLLGVGVDLLDGAVLAESRLFFGDRFGDFDPDGAGAAARGEAKGRVGAPVASRFPEDDVFGDEFDVWFGDALAQPFALHLEGFSED